MKKKRLSFWLLPLVLLIWGGIAFRWWGSRAQARPEAVSVPPPARQPLNWGRPARRSLQLNYRDPFLDRSALASLRPRPNAQGAARKPKAKPPQLRFRYRGGVKPAGGQALIGLLEQEGQLMQLREGEMCGDWRVQQLSLAQAILRKGNMQLVLSREP
jgi:hypothetical protein